MFYKILPGNQLFTQLTELSNEMRRCNSKALELVKSIGYERFRLGWEGLAGGISAIQIPGGAKQGWKGVMKKDKESCMPSDIPKNKELLDRISKLPHVSSKSLNDLLNFEEYIDEDTNRYFKNPFVHWRNDVILVKVDDIIEGYTPLPDMIEITTTEYFQLKDTIAAPTDERSVATVTQ